MSAINNKLSLKPIGQSFILGTAFPFTLIPFLYLGLAHKKLSKNNERIPGFYYEDVPIYLPLVYGSANALSKYLGMVSGWDKKGEVNWKRLLLTGVVVGFSLSMIGRHNLQLPRRLFKMKPQQEYRVHIVAPILYGLSYLLLVGGMEKLFLCK